MENRSVKGGAISFLSLKYSFIHLYSKIKALGNRLQASLRLPWLPLVVGNECRLFNYPVILLYCICQQQQNDCSNQSCQPLDSGEPFSA